MLVTGGGIGVNASGNGVTLSNNGNITVKDSDSVGVNVTGNNAAVSNTGNIYATDYATGALISGDHYDILLDGTIIVDATEARQSATGVVISGNSGLLKISGDVKAFDTTLGSSEDLQRIELIGTQIQGENNTLIIDGSIHKIYEGSIDSRVKETFQTGLLVSGDANTVIVNGGINTQYIIDSSDPKHKDHGFHSGFYIDGNNNTLILNGDNFLLHHGPAHRSYFGYISGYGNNIVFDDDSIFEVNMDYYRSDAQATQGAIIFLENINNTVLNKGTIRIDKYIGYGIVLGGTIVNEGTVDVTISEPNQNISNLFFSGKIINNGNIELTSFLEPAKNAGWGSSEGGIFGFLGQSSAISSNTMNSNLVNDTDGSIKVSGAGTFVMTGQYGTFFNKGEIIVDGMQLHLDKHGESDGIKSLYNNNSHVALNGRQYHLEFSSVGEKNIAASETLSLTPYAGMKLRHHITEGYSERGAGDFNLTTNSCNETGVDAIAGLRLNYAGENGWGAAATLEAGQNLSFSQSTRPASLQGMQGQNFNIDDGKRSGGMNSQLSVGVNYQHDALSFGAQAYQWKEDGASDNGFSLNVTRRF